MKEFISPEFRSHTQRHFGLRITQHLAYFDQTSTNAATEKVDMFYMQLSLRTAEKNGLRKMSIFQFHVSVCITQIHLRTMSSYIVHTVEQMTLKKKEMFSMLFSVFVRMDNINENKNCCWSQRKYYVKNVPCNVYLHLIHSLLSCSVHWN